MNKNTFHILVVDDDNRIRELVKEYLDENNNVIDYFVQLSKLIKDV